MKWAVVTRDAATGKLLDFQIHEGPWSEFCRCREERATWPGMSVFATTRRDRDALEQEARTGQPPEGDQSEGYAAEEFGTENQYIVRLFRGDKLVLAAPPTKFRARAARLALGYLGVFPWEYRVEVELRRVGAADGPQVEGREFARWCGVMD